MQQTEKVRPIIHENTKELSGEDTTMQLKPEEISKIIRAQIKHYENVIEQSEVGTVILVGDGIARASGLEKCMAGELLQFDNGEYGMAQNLEENTVSIVLLGSDVGIKRRQHRQAHGQGRLRPGGRSSDRPCRQRAGPAHRRRGPH